MTGIFQDTRRTTDPFNTKWVTGNPTGFIEQVNASFKSAKIQMREIGEVEALKEGYDKRIEEIEKATGKKLDHPLRNFIPEAHKGEKGLSFISPRLLSGGRSEAAIMRQEDFFEKQVDELRSQSTPDLAGKIINRDQMFEGISINAKNLEEKRLKLLENGGKLGLFADFLGSAGAIFTDPVIILTAPVGIGNLAGRSTLQAMGRTAASEALIGGSVEALIQPQVQEFRKRLGFKDAGFKAGLTNVAFAAGGGAVLGATIQGISRVLPELAKSAGREKFTEKFLGKELNRIIEAHQFNVEESLKSLNGANTRTLSKSLDSIPNKTRETEVLARELEKDADLQDDNPLEKTENGAVEHEQRTAIVDEAAIKGDQPDIPLTPETRVDPEAIKSRADATNSVHLDLKPEELKVDAERFQFKSEGDSKGVTKRLAGVKEWDQTKAGLIVAWEDAAGNRFVADGHQRTALARRIQEQKPEVDVRLIGIVRREADGFSADDVKIEAAMKNIAETETVTPQLAIDAAKVLRITGENMKALIDSLPPSSSLVRSVNGLINLSDNAFSTVINGKVSSTHAGFLGRLVPDDEGLQDAIIDVLVREKVATKTDIEAEAIIRQAKDVGTRREVQAGLFGEEIFERSLFSERARVLKMALQRLRRDKNIFSNLTRNKGEIQGAGNQLVEGRNAKIAEENAIALQVLQKIANRQGPISDALTAGAREAAESGKFGAAADNFAGAVRGAIERSDLEGATIGGDGRSLQDTAQAVSDTSGRAVQSDTVELEKFDSPESEGPIAQAESIRQEIESRPENLEADIPVAQKVDDATNQVVAETRTVKEILEEIDEDENFVTELGACAS